tara:strand:+ start:479 stop:631 length:153 start_codon:yes stop_codon:yes gene_type:complete
MFNIFLYSGIALIILGLILFIKYQYKLRDKIKEEELDKKLHQSFIRNKLK